MLLCVVESLHQVFKRSAAPVAVDRVDELLSVSVEPWKLIMMTTYPGLMKLVRRRVRDSSGSSIVSPGTLRPAVNEELHGYFLLASKFGGLIRKPSTLSLLAPTNQKDPRGTWRLGRGCVVEVSKFLRFT